MITDRSNPYTCDINVWTVLNNEKQVIFLRIIADLFLSFDNHGLQPNIYTTLSCNPIQLDGEQGGSSNFEIENLGGNECVCMGESKPCKVQTSNIMPPDDTSL